MRPISPTPHEGDSRAERRLPSRPPPPPRPIADAYFDHPAVRKISFTGSTEVGKELIRRSADQVKRLSLELGGHAPLIVFPDADVQQVAQAAVIGKFRNNGQVCIAPSRFYVHEKISKDFTEAA